MGSKTEGMTSEEKAAWKAAKKAKKLAKAGAVSPQAILQLLVFPRSFSSCEV